ncbi:MAG: hypothetical protein C4326_00160 [Ignavibacteria bacterium]
MESKSPLRIRPQVVLGLIIVVIGVLLTLDNLEILYARDYLRYWPALLMVYGIVKILSPETHASRFLGVVLAFIGAALLVDRLDMFSFRLWDFWPLLLVALGVLLLFRSGALRTKVPSQRPTVPIETDNSSVVNAAAFFGGTVRNMHSKDFRGGELTAVMGGCEIDLHNAAIVHSPAVLDVFTLWGGIEIKVPPSWTVIFEGTPVMGGFADKTIKQSADENQKLIIRGTIIMGGVEVRH